MLAESTSLRSNGALWAKVASATIELAQLLATNKIDEASADAIGAEKVREAMLRTQSGSVGAAGGGDGNGEGYAAKYAQLKHAAVATPFLVCFICHVRINARQTKLIVIIRIIV